MSSDSYQKLQMPAAELVTESIERIEARVSGHRTAGFTNST